MNKNKIVVIVCALIVVCLSLVYIVYTNNQNDAQTKNPSNVVDTTVVYKNSDYGFTFSLPNDWLGYSVIENSWQGNSLTAESVSETGPKLLIRNPLWTDDIRYQDIPILIFTISQWNSYVAEDLAVSAAPISASELSQNNSYVFALPPRWDFDYSLGFEQAQSIVRSKPIQTFDVATISAIKDGRYCYAFHQESTDSEPYTISEMLDITISGTNVSGTKNGTQFGPDMTNGYIGSINGSVSGNIMSSIFSYTVEGSSNKESEIYRLNPNSANMDKLRYLLIEKKGILVPDTTKEFKIMTYARVDCIDSN